MGLAEGLQCRTSLDLTLVNRLVFTYLHSAVSQRAPVHPELQTQVFGRSKQSPLTQPAIGTHSEQLGPRQPSKHLNQMRYS